MKNSIQIDLFSFLRKKSTNNTEEIRLNDECIVYELVRSTKRRTIGISIGLKGLRVLAPQSATLTQIQKILHNKTDWILKHLHKTRQVPQVCIFEQIHLDTALPYLGSELRFLIAEGSLTHPPIVSHGPGGYVLTLYGLKLTSNASQLLQPQVLAWWTARATHYFKERLDYWAPLIGVRYLGLRLSSAKRIWGSACSTGVISLNWKLLKFRPELIDYVVVHELCHLHEMNHSAVFWRHVELQLPNHKHLRKELNFLPK
jgi:predicted metal-dependent hydrolase